MYGTRYYVYVCVCVHAYAQKTHTRSIKDLGRAKFSRPIKVIRHNSAQALEVSQSDQAKDRITEPVGLAWRGHYHQSQKTTVDATTKPLETRSVLYITRHAAASDFAQLGLTQGCTVRLEITNACSSISYPGRLDVSRGKTCYGVKGFGPSSRVAASMETPKVADPA